MAKTKVRVLYATAFTGAGIEVWHIERDKRGRVVAEMPLEVVEVDRKLADALIQAGHAEAVK